MAKEICEELERLLRTQRHDFINHLQVIHTMVQLGRTEKVLKYIENLATDPALLTDALRLHHEQPACQRKTGL